MGSGADVRQASLRTRAGTLAGRTTPTPSTAAVMAVTNGGLDWLEFWPSAAAQQLSACACVRRALIRSGGIALVHRAFDAVGAARHSGFRRRQPSRTDRRVPGHKAERERECRETVDEPHHVPRMLDHGHAVKPGVAQTTPLCRVRPRPAVESHHESGGPVRSAGLWDLRGASRRARLPEQRGTGRRTPS